MFANINKVEDFALSHENKPWKQFTIKKLHDGLAYFLGLVSTMVN